MISFNRRSILKSATAAAVFGVPTVSVAAKRPARASRLRVMLDRFADEILRLSPTTATSLGLDRGARAALKSKLDDNSPAGKAKWAAQVQSMAKRLATINVAALSPDEQTLHATALHAANAGIDGIKFSFGGAESGFFGGTSPFPVTQQDGAVSGIPEFLNSLHDITSAADGEAYLMRAAAMARVLDNETADINEQRAKGIAPPSFILATALEQLRGYRAVAAADQGLVTSLATRAKAAGVSGDWATRTTKLVEQLIYPALDRQIAALAAAAKTATDVAGVHRLPDGEAYYAWALKLGTTTTASAEEIHRIGLDQNKAIQARMDAILRAQGMTQGSVGERVQALNKDPRQLYADDDGGRAALIAYCNDRVAATRALMPKLSRLGMKAPLLVKRVPTDIEAGAALGYMNFASLDGSRPAIYYINLKSTTLWPKYQIATLTAHEGLPGHAWQGAYLAENSAKIPLIASLTGFNAFVEGWALYAEQLMDEAGLYADDPFGQIGYLQAQQFRACRLVVDTGLHALRWTREKAIDFLVAETGKGANAMTSEVDRYSVSPGQACGYKMGHNEINRLRDRARAALGDKFDLATFNDTVVMTGGVPLTVLSGVIDRMIAKA